GRAVTTATDDLLASGVLSPVVEITSDDPRLRDDPTVGVRFVGRDGEAADEMGASLVAGHLASNRTRVTTHPAQATLHLPLFKYTDPLVLDTIGLEMDLDGGAAGFVGALRGAWPAPGYLAPAAAGFQHMLNAHPTEFPLLGATFDTNRDGVIEEQEFL